MLGGGLGSQPSHALLSEFIPVNQIPTTEGF
jgi:hypothetical protein